MVKGVNERRILEAAARGLKRTTGFDIRIREIAPGRVQALDAVIDLFANGQKFRFFANVKTMDRFETPALLTARGNGQMPKTLLVAPYITRGVAEQCRELHLPFVDTAGNTFLEAPGLLAFVVGQPKPSDLDQDRFRALNAAGLQIVFALLCQPTILETSYREIAARAGVALGTVGPVLKDLELRKYLRYGRRGDRKLFDPARLLDEWVAHYPVTLRPKLNAQRFHAEPDHLLRMDMVRLNALWGGEVAADKLTRYLKPAHYTIYTREPVAKLAGAGKMQAGLTNNIEILERFWEFDPDPNTPDIVPAILVYADLLATSDPRNVEAARIIYEQQISPTFPTPH